MPVARLFLGVGSLYLVLGIGLGIYMGASGDHSISALHAHVNLLGFALSMFFGLVYHLFPVAGGSTLARMHFWLHLAGGTLLLVMLGLMLTGRITEAAMVPLAPIAELAVLLGAVIFSTNVWRHVR